MDPHHNLSTPASRTTLLPPAGYRVVARHADRSLSLITLAENLRQAVNLARTFCDRVAPHGHEIVAVHVEEWVGTLTEGAWQRVSLRQVGFSRGLTTPSARHSSRNGHHCRSSLPRTGDKVPCVLLSDKTRKGGWRARLVQGRVEGPITNTADVPKWVIPGQTVMLRLGAISQDGTRLQFRWCDADNGG